MTQRRIGGSAEFAVKQVSSLSSDAALQRFVLRALGDVTTRRRVLDPSSEARSTQSEVFAAGLKGSEPRIKLEAIVSTTRQSLNDLAPQIAALLGDADSVVAHTAFRGLAILNAHEACFAIVDNYDASAAQRTGAFRALMRMHTPAVVQGLIDRLAKETGTEARKGLLAALCRLHFVDGEWKGDSWGTRPDTRGPYYQPDSWSETPKIAEILKATLAKASPDEAGFLVGELNRNRVQFDEALGRIIELAKKDASLAPQVVAQVATADSVPTDAIPMLVAAARDENGKPATLAQAITAITKTDNAEAWAAALNALVALDHAKGSGKEVDAGKTAFFTAPKLENVHQAMETEAAKVGTPTAPWAEAALLALSERKTGSPESREMSQKALDAGWLEAKRRVQIIHAAEKAKSHAMDAKILAAIADPDKSVAKAAEGAVKSLKLKKDTKDNGPLIGTMKPEDVIAQVVKMKGDAALGDALFGRGRPIRPPWR